MHGSSLARMAWFVQTWLPHPPHRLKVLDVGSMDVAGGTYKQFFQDCDYQGLDLAPGANVDIVPGLPYHWPEVASETYDVVVSGQALEHMEFFWLAALEMTRVLKSGGLMCLIAPRGFARHRYPVDCWRFDADGMVAIARYCGLVPLHASCDMAPPDGDGSWHIEHSEDALLVARKPDPWPGAARAESYQFQTQDMDALTGNFQPCPPTPQMEMMPRWEYEKSCDEYKADIARLAGTIQAKEAEIASLRRRLEGYEQSKSWKITRPLRTAAQLLRKCRR